MPILEGNDGVIEAIFQVVIGEFDGEDMGEGTEGIFEGIEGAGSALFECASQVDIVDDGVEEDIFIEGHL